MMSKPIVPTEQLEEVIRQMPDAFTILDLVDAFQEEYPDVWDGLVERYGLYGSGTRYSALTYLSNRISAYARRKAPALLEPTPKGWEPREGRYLRRSTKEERKRFGSPWIVIFRRRRTGGETHTASQATEEEVAK
jgi:hypothetical protein